MLSSPSLAVFAILSLALSVWFFKVASDPKRWRLWWLYAFGILDTDTTRTARRTQESQLRGLALSLSVLLVFCCLSCSFWALDGVRESLREKSIVERDEAFLKKHIASKSHR